jgi:hypothetical protein
MCYVMLHIQHKHHNEIPFNCALMLMIVSSLAIIQLKVAFYFFPMPHIDSLNYNVSEQVSVYVWEGLIKLQKRYQVIWIKQARCFKPWQPTFFVWKMFLNFHSRSRVWCGCRKTPEIHYIHFREIEVNSHDSFAKFHKMKNFIFIAVSLGGNLLNFL